MSLKQFFDNQPARLYRKRTIIFDAYNDAYGLYFISEGRVRVSILTESGQEFILYTLGEGDFFSLPSYFSDDDWPLTYTAETDVKAWWRPREEVDAYLNSHPNVYRDILNVTLHLMYTRINTLSRTQSEERVARRILELADKFGCEAAAKDSVELQITQQELADSVSLSRESVCLILNKFENRGIVGLKRNKLIVDVPKTKAMVEKS